MHTKNTDKYEHWRKCTKVGLHKSAHVRLVSAENMNSCQSKTFYKQKLEHLCYILGSMSSKYAKNSIVLPVELILKS